MAAPPSYKIKRVGFFGRRDVPVVLQNENGPCPLLAIANCLLLRNTLKLPAGAPDVSQDRLLALVAEQLLDSNEGLGDGAAQAALEANRQQNVSDSISHLPKLTTGLDVNVRFDRGAHGFEYTDEVVVFDLLGISLVHGWLIDSQNSDLVKAMKGRSYNEVVCWLVPLISQSSNTAQRLLSGSWGVPSPTAAAAPSSPLPAPTLPQVHAEGERTEDGTSAGVNKVEDVEDEESVVSSVVSQIMGCVLSRAEGKQAWLAAYKQTDDPLSPVSAADGADIQGGSGGKLSPLSSASNAEMLPAEAQPTGAKLSKDSGPNKATGAEEEARNTNEWDVALVQAFLDSSASQLTDAGVLALHRSLRPNELAVFFRNNHFSTIFKHEDALYLLVTDVGFAYEADIIWERLDSAHGATSFYNSEFAPFVPHSSSARETALGVDLLEGAFAASADTGNSGPQPPPAPSSHTDADFALALQLQEQMEEEERQLREQQEQAARQQQQQQSDRAQQNPMHARQQQQQQQQQASAARRQQQQQQPRRGQAPSSHNQGRQPREKGRTLEERAKDCSIM